MNERGNPTRVSITDDAHPSALSEVAGLLRNQWPLSPGIPGRLAAEYARKDRWAWNFGIQQGRPITVRENRRWKPAVAYCRYADDFVVIVKGTRAQAEAIREECRAFLEDRLKLTLNMDKTHITHVDDGFVFLGHRIIRKRGSSGRMSVVTTVPKEKAKTFARRLVEALSGNHDVAAVDMTDSLNRQLAGWAAFYKFTDFAARTFRRIDPVVFWKTAHWLARKYRSRIKPLMRKWYRAPEIGQTKTWLIYGRSNRENPVGKALRRLVTSQKAQFRWRGAVWKVVGIAVMASPAASG